jgi:hypothetical protein
VTNLTEKTNFELNVLVAMLEHPELAKHPDDMIKECDGGSALFEWAPEFTDDWWRQECYDYTGEWEQMGPIMIKNCIQYSFDTCQVHVSSYFNESAKCSARHDELLRCAAICYLMMKGAE